MMTTTRRPAARRAWVSYLRVSTQEQADRDLSLPAQRTAIEAYTWRNGQTIAREYIEEGGSGTSTDRETFSEMLSDVTRKDSDVAAILVHHSSRFSRNATQARVVKEKLKKAGVRVISICQETNDDAVGALIDGIFECIDQYESEINGTRTSEAMREAVRQGYYPGSLPPYGFRKAKVEPRPGLTRYKLVPDEREAAIVREIFQLYVTHGATGVAGELRRRGIARRSGRPWTKDDVLELLASPAVYGTVYWGKTSPKARRSELLPLSVEPIIDRELWELTQRLRLERHPDRASGRAPAPTTLLSRLVRCGRCGASYRLETSGKRSGGDEYRYRYYNCRSAESDGAVSS